MKSAFIIIFLGLILASCQKEVDKNTDLRSVQSSDSVAFEIRDFKIDKTDTRFDRTFQGRGTVLVKDPRLQDRSIYLVLKQKEIPKIGDIKENYKWVVLNNGIGTIETYSVFSYGTPEYNQPSAPEFEWTVLGWVEMKKGTLTITK